MLLARNTERRLSCVQPRPRRTREGSAIQSPREFDHRLQDHWEDHGRG